MATYTITTVDADQIDITSVRLNCSVVIDVPAAGEDFKLEVFLDDVSQLSVTHTVSTVATIAKTESTVALTTTTIDKSHPGVIGTISDPGTVIE